VASIPARIESVVAEYRQRLADLEAAYTRAVGPAQAALRVRLRDEAGRFIRDMRNAGLPDRVTRQWVTRHDDYQQLLRMAEAELDRITTEAVRVIQWQIAEAASLGKPAADALTIATLGASPTEAALLSSSFGQVNTGAVLQMVGQLQQASPLANLPRLNREAVETMGRELVRGLAEGTHSSTVGRRIARASDIPRARAATIARTEMHRAYRESNRLAYEANPLVGSWVWHAGLGVRTCAACWAMHGSVHPLDEAMGSHPNCRCTQLPSVTPPAWMNAPDVTYPTGEELFAALPEGQQRAILGAERHARYAAGDLPLASMVRETTTREWGTTRTVSPLTPTG